MTPPTLATTTPLALTPSPANNTTLRTISVLVRNQPGVLVRVSLVFARRGFNIESLVVSPDITNGDFSRMTITCRGDDDALDQISKQLTKLIDVVHAIDHTGQAVVETEIALLKIKAVTIEARAAILQVVEHYKAKVVDFGSESMVLRVYGESEKLDSFVALLKPFDMIELVRSGKILMTRGPATT